MAVNPPITRDELRRLALHRAPSAMTTCYLDVDGRRFLKPQDLQRSVEVVLRRARAEAGTDRSRMADIDRIAEFVRQGIDRSRTRGLAFFSHHGEGFWKVVALPCPVPNHVIAGASPSVAPLEVALSDHEPIGVLLVDKAKLRMLVFSWDELVDYADLVTEMLAPELTPSDVERGPREQAHLDQRLGERQARHVRNAARVAFDLQARTGFERLVVGGPDAVVVEVERLLHPYLRKIYHGRIASNPAAGSDEIAKVVRVAESEIARAREATLVGRLREAVGRPESGQAPSGRPDGGTGRSAGARNGLEAVLSALATHRVERILVSDGFEQEGWRCAQCARLTTVGPTCPGCAAVMDPVADLISEAVDQAIAERARVHVCVDNADLDELGRIGALLRY